MDPSLALPQHNTGDGLRRPSFNTSNSSNLSAAKPLPPAPNANPSPKHVGEGWRPFTLKVPFLLGFLGATVALIGTLEVLVQRSQSNGAVAFTMNAESYIDHLLNYGPLLFSVMYGLVFASIDHDIKRLEPYLQLAAPGGAKAEHSLFMAYPYMLHLLAPVIALRNKHWRVFCSGTIVLLIMYGITPLMAAVLSKEQNIERTTTFPVQIANFIPPDQQTDNITTSFAYEAYRFRYLNSTLPPYMTEKYAVLPFKPTLEKQPPVKNETWMAETTVYEGSLECEKAKVYYKQRDGSGWVVVVSRSNGDCELQMPVGDEEYSASRAQYATFMGRLEWDHFGGGPCIHKLFGFWGRQRDPNREDLRYGPRWDKITALFCNPKHEKQQAKVTVDSASGHILTLEPLGVKSRLESLNNSAWERAFFDSSTYKTTGNNHTTNAAIRGWPRHHAQMLKMSQFLEGHDKFNPNTNVSELLWGVQPQPVNVFTRYPESWIPFSFTHVKNLTTLSNYKTLQKSYSDAYRYLFAFGVTGELTTFTGGVEPVESTAERTYRAEGYVMDNLWTRVLQAILGLTSVLVGSLLALLLNRPSGISEDPGSIAASMARIDVSVLHAFDGAEFLSPKILKSTIVGGGLYFELKDQKIRVRGIGSTQGAGTPTTQPQHTIAPGKIDRSKVVLRKPWDLTLYSGAVATIFVLGLGVLLTVLFARNQHLNGFKYPGNSFLFNLYASYAPTIAATLFEGFLVLLASHVTLLYPFRTLCRGNAPYDPLTVNFENTAPHLQTLNGIRTRNYLLASLSSAVLLANVLAVTLGSLFYKDLIYVAEVGNVVIRGTPDVLHAFDASGPPLKRGPLHVDSDFFYASTGNDSLYRPWMNDEFFFIPFSDTDVPGGRSNYSAETWGIGITTVCEAIPYNVETILLPIAIPKPVPISLNEFFMLPNQPGAQNLTSDIPVAAGSKSLSLGYYPDIPEFAEGLVNEFSKGNDGHYSEVVYSELPPSYYPEGLGGDWDFMASWTKYALKNRTVTISIAYDPNPSWADPDNLDFEPAPQKVLGHTMSGYSAELVASNIMRCRIGPRVVRARVHVPDLSKGFIDRKKVDILSTVDIPSPKNNATGLAAIVATFQEMILRTAGLSREGTYNVASKLDGTVTPSGGYHLTPDAASWPGVLLQQELQSTKNHSYDLYSYPEQSRRAMERIYTRAFATYLQLHTNDFFPNITGPTVPARFKKADAQRILMAPAAYYVSIILIMLFLPVVMWTYASLLSAFVCHEPVSIAGNVAAFYASKVVEDVAGTEELGIKEREKRLKLIGDKYMYGWSVGIDGQKHFGIDKEPR